MHVTFCQQIFFKKIFKNIHMSKSLDPDQDLHSVRSDLGPNCLQRLLANKKVNRILVMERYNFIAEKEM